MNHGPNKQLTVTEMTIPNVRKSYAGGINTAVFILLLTSFFELCSAFQFKLPLHTKSSVPSPPWTFEASKIFYQFQAIPINNARKFCPPCQNQNENSSSPLFLLSLGGYTLGGIFCVEYQNSPIGPYREVAILSSLVTRPPSPLSGVWIPAIGAWASHIFVDSQDAADYGQRFWGLPASVVSIQFDHEDGTQDCTFSNDEIVVSGWEEAKDDSRPLDWFDVSLPSFSGLLPGEDNSVSSGQVSSLLQYPLSIIQPSSLGFASCKSISFDGKCNNTPMQEVQEMLEGSQPIIAANVGKVNLVAGVPTVVE